MLGVKHSAGRHLSLLVACDHEGDPACVLCALPSYVNKLASLRAWGQDCLVSWTDLFPGFPDLPKFRVLYGEVFARVLVPREVYLACTEAMSPDSVVEVCDGKGKCASVDFGSSRVQPDELSLELLVDLVNGCIGVSVGLVTQLQFDAVVYELFVWRLGERKQRPCPVHPDLHLGVVAHGGDDVEEGLGHGVSALRV